MTPDDAADWLEMRHLLWPEDARERHADEVERFLAGELRLPLAVLLAFEGERAVGFVELSIRSYAEGCETDRVGFLEGWYVKSDARRRGVGAALIRAAEEWARGQGCTEFASDAVFDNEISQAAHLALGFDEVVQIRCFRKSLVR